MQCALDNVAEGSISYFSDFAVTGMCIIELTELVLTGFGA